MFYTMASFWGFAEGAFLANVLGVIYSFCDVSQLAVLFGLNMMAQSIGSLAGVSLIGKKVIYTSSNLLSA